MNGRSRASFILAMTLSAGCNKSLIAGLQPDISATPEAVAFDAASLAGGSAARTVIVSNEGGSGLRIEAIALAPDAPAGMSWAGPGESADLPVLAEGGWFALQILYSPADFAPHATHLEIRSNDPDEEVVTIQIDTEPTGPYLVCSPDPVVFVQAPLTPTTRTVNCANEGNAALTITGVEPAPGTSADFTGVWPAVPATLAPLESLPPFSITYTPDVLGTDSGAVLLHGTMGDYVLELEGTGTDQPLCDLTATPMALFWGDVYLGAAPGKTVVLNNAGSAICHVSAVDFEAFTGEFHYAGPQVFDVAPGSPHSLTVSYVPADRFPDIGALRVHSDDPAEAMLEILVQGEGVGPEVDLLPCPVSFGAVTLGCKNDRTVTLYNSGDRALDYTLSFGPGTSELSLLSPATGSVPPSGSANIALRLQPVSTGVKSRVLRVTSNDGDEPVLECLLEGAGTTSDHQVDAFTQATSQKADVLFVVDNSGSMSQEQDTLASSFSSFASYLVAQSVSFQVGVTTTDIDVLGAKGALVGTPKIITNATPNAAAKFAQNAQVGNGGDGKERGLDAARLALTPPLVSGANAGFLRPEARLFLIFVTDEDDKSPDSDSLQPASYYVDAYSNVKGYNPDLLELHAIAGDVPDGCATAAAGFRYKEVVDAVGGSYSTICTSNFSSALQNIGIEAASLQSAFPLSREPVVATIVVRVDGVVQPAAAWSYDPASNAVLFAAGSVPAVGAAIVAEYDVLCE